MPLIFIHRGDSEVLEAVLNQARVSNPDSRIIVLCDQPHGKKVDRVECYSLEDYFDGARQFERYYIHGSVYPLDFELFCFQRWFVLLEFMKAENLSYCFHLDSDVLLFSDLELMLRRFRGVQLSLCGGNCAHSSYLTAEALAEFCDATFKIFSEDPAILGTRIYKNELFAAMHWREERQPLNDMLLFECFAESSGSAVLELSAIVDNAAFDYSIAYPESGYSMQDGFKRITWLNGVPYCYHERFKREVRFHSLHCRGAGKGRLPKLLEQAEKSRASASL